MKLTIPVEFDVVGKTSTQCHNLLNEFLRLSFREFAASYNIVDYKKD